MGKPNMKAIEKAVHMVNGKKVVASLSGHCGTVDMTADSGGHGLCREWWETPSVVAKCRCGCHEMEKVERKIVAKTMGKARTEANAKVLVKKSL